MSDKTLEQRIGWAYDVLAAFHPQTVRQVYYVAISEGWLAPDTGKTKRRSYRAVQSALEQGRRRGDIPWGWVVDVGRLYRRNFTERDLSSFAREAELYYTPPADHGALLWVEKDTIVPTIEDIADDFVCPLVSGRGFSGLSHIRKVVLDLDGIVRQILFVGDHDPSGLAIDSSLEDNLLSDFGIEWSVERIALTWGQAQGLPHIGLKSGDSRTPAYRAYFGDRAWEVEALPVERLRQIVSGHLSNLFPDTEKSAYEERLETERAEIRQAMKELS